MRRTAFALLALAACSDARERPDRDSIEPSAEAGVDATASRDAEPEDRSVPVDAGLDDASDPELEERTPATCGDLLDNDGDTYVDCRDFDCRGVEFCGPENTTAACTDGADNDGDDYADCVDFGCRRIPPCDLPEDSNLACSDGVDNDADQAVDCADSGCAPAPVCRPREDDNPTCRDGADNDGDQTTDCADSDCANASVCGTTEDADASCSDGVDNDGDQSIDCRDDGCVATPSCNRTRLRVATWNIQTLGSTSSAEHRAALAFAGRVSPDSICFEEVEASEGRRLADFAAAGAYPYFAQGRARTALAGGLTNACLSRWPITASASLSSRELSPDRNANDTGRDPIFVRVEVRPGAEQVALFAAHLKSGFQDSDRVRRQVEAERMRIAIARHRAAYPSDGVIAMGDFNEEAGASILGTVYASPPPGMPPSYALGSDLSYPITYDPFATLRAAGLELTAPTHEDSVTLDATRIPSGRRIDFLVFSTGALLLEGDEVFNPCRDNGIDDPPDGNYLAKTGTSASCADDAVPSDHRMVFADFALP